MSYKEKRVSSLIEPAPVRAELIVRPDVLRVSFSVSLEADGLEQNLPPLQRACEQLLRRVREVTGAEVSLALRDTRFSRPVSRKLSLPEDDDRTFIAVNGQMTLVLPAELDFWARSSRAGTLTRACHELERDSREVKRSPRFEFSPVQALVAQPESHRVELLRRFVSRVRELTATVGSAEAPLHVVDCSPPGPVEQTPLSLEEVALALPILCRLDVVPPGAP